MTKDIEEELYESLMGRRKPFKREEIIALYQTDSEDFINVLFSDAINIIRGFKEEYTIYKVERIFDYLDYLRDYDINVTKKVKQLSKEIVRVMRMNMSLIEELQSLSERTQDYREERKRKSNPEYDFISFLIREPQNIEYVDFAFKKMPSIMKSKDRNERTLFFNVVMRYIDGIDVSSADKTYYRDLINLMLANDEFEPEKEDLKELLEIIYTKVEQMSRKKKNQKKNKEKIEELRVLKESLKPKKKKKKELQDVADKYRVNVEFKSSILDIIRQNKDKASKVKNREEVPDYIITIDGENAVEIDDGLSCRKLSNGNYLLGVHIASILGYFKYDSEIVEEAFDRVHTVYLNRGISGKENDGLITIFPYEFAAEIASLQEGKDKLARSYYFEIDAFGNIIQEAFLKTKIRNSRRSTYKEINEMLETPLEGEDDLTSTVRNLKEVTRVLASVYHPDELYEKMKQNRDDPSELVVKQVGSERIVYYAMLLVGNRVAKFFHDHNYPFIYRTHEIDEELNNKINNKLIEIKEQYGDVEDKKLYSIMDGIYPKAKYALEGGHMGLNLPYHCHITSGLRRAADIATEHALEVCYDKVPTKEDLVDLRIDLEEKCERVNRKAGALERFQEEANKTIKKRF